MKRVLLAGLLGGVTLFAWSFVSHAVLRLGSVGVGALPPPPADASFLEAVGGAAPRPGLFVFPGVDESRMHDTEAMEEWEQRAAASPYGLLIVHRAGHYPGMGGALGLEVATNLALGLLAAVLLSCVGGRLRRYWARVGFVALLGLVASYRVVQNWNWWGYPSDYSLALAADAVLGCAVMGLVLAAVLRPPGERPVEGHREAR